MLRKRLRRQDSRSRMVSILLQAFSIPELHYLLSTITSSFYEESALAKDSAHTNLRPHSLARIFARWAFGDYPLKVELSKLLKPQERSRTRRRKGSSLNKSHYSRMTRKAYIDSLARNCITRLRLEKKRLARVGRGDEVVIPTRAALWNIIHRKLTQQHDKWTR